MKSGYTKEYKFDIIETAENKCQSLFNILEAEEDEYIATRVRAFCDIIYNLGAFLEDTLFRERYPYGIILEKDDRMQITFMDPEHEKLEDGHYRSCRYILVTVTYPKNK